VIGRIALALVLLPLPTAAGAQTVYTWTDAEGVQHFTDSLKSAPADAKVTTTAGSHVNVLSMGSRPATTTPASAGDVQQAAAQAQAAAAEARAAANRVQALEQVAAEDAWRARFREAREAVRVLQDDVEADRLRVEEVAGLPMQAGVTCLPVWPGVMPAPLPVGVGPVVGAPGASMRMPGGALVAMPCFLGASPEYERLRDRLARNRAALVRAKEALADLERRAALEAVPLEWRR
jgi:hypothetical protein